MIAHQRALSLHGADDGPLAASAGSGSTGVALFHGFTSGPVSVTGWARALASAGASVEVPLLPGHGTRWQDLRVVTAEEWRATARDTVDRLFARHDRVVVAGLSMGGALALDAAAHRSVSGVVVVNPGLRFASPAAPLARVLKYAVRSVAPIANDAARPGVDEQAYPRTPVAAVQQVGALQAAARAGLPAITAPVLAFRSTTDRVVPHSSMAALARGLAPGLLTVRPLYNSFHVATLDWDAGVIEDESVRFIAGLACGRADVRG
ncbi:MULTISPECIES: carboxylesterase [Micrococcaceae]|uniref:alpha/beta hydrolase n=1 Tax=Micrococcaceae TaxID=1268 RepID=UPI001619BEBC|nr:MULTISPECIES: alpha/beta fold hydrolase [Micrococcaceae]MBB5749206.1 carboxylesterase [Micrococcus sp. TA1]HRO29405.1 alpha/beta fold hydrolase [Citricoccus sp.]HRO93024.1 alpha/beta fold hydrolase [Citricoccus sp.]